MNPLVVWSEELVIGVPEIDAHHKALVGLLNELHLAVHRRLGVAACRKAVEKLHHCALSHFETEQKLMHLSGHTAFAGDRAEQRELLRHLDAMLARLDGRDSNITFRGLHELKACVLAHVRSMNPRNPERAVVESGAGSPASGIRLTRT